MSGLFSVFVYDHLKVRSRRIDICSGCFAYHPSPPHQVVGTGLVCSSSCSEITDVALKPKNVRELRSSG